MVRESGCNLLKETRLSAVGESGRLLGERCRNPDGDGDCSPATGRWSQSGGSAAFGTNLNYRSRTLGRLIIRLLRFGEPGFRRRSLSSRPIRLKASTRSQVNSDRSRRIRLESLALLRIPNKRNDRVEVRICEAIDGWHRPKRPVMSRYSAARRKSEGDVTVMVGFVDL